MKRVLAVVVGVMVAGVAVSGDPAPAAPAAPAAAAPAVDKLVAYREAEMSILGKHMKAAGLIARGEVARPQDLLRHAEALKAGGTDLLAMFPEGSGPDKVAKTEAKAEVWTKRAEFEAAIKKYQDETAKLVEVAKGGDLAASKAQLDKVGETCGGCHDTFKVKDH